MQGKELNMRSGLCKLELESKCYYVTKSYCLGVGTTIKASNVPQPIIILYLSLNLPYTNYSPTILVNFAMPVSVSTLTVVLL